MATPVWVADLYRSNGQRALEPSYSRPGCFQLVPATARIERRSLRRGDIVCFLYAEGYRVFAVDPVRRHAKIRRDDAAGERCRRHFGYHVSQP